MNLLEAIDARPELFALAMIIAFVLANAWMVALVVITGRSEERLARMRLIRSEDVSQRGPDSACPQTLVAGSVTPSHQAPEGE